MRWYFVPMITLCFGSLAVLFIHPWTWLTVMVGLVAFLIMAVAFRLKNAVRDVGSVLVVILLSAGALVLSLLELSKTQGWRVVEAFSYMPEGLGSKYFGPGSWEIVVFFSQIWSQFLNPVLLVLSILGVVVLARRRDRFSVAVFASNDRKSLV